MSKGQSQPEIGAALLHWFGLARPFEYGVLIVAQMWAKTRIMFVDLF